MVAARELTHAGHRCLLLEARSRLGGLTYVDTWAGQRVEHGGTWVSWRQPHAWSEITRYGLTLTEDPRPDIMAMPAGKGVGWHTPAEAITRLNRLFDAYFSGTEGTITNPQDPLRNAERLRELDQYSLGDWLRKRQFTQEDRDWMVSVLCLAGGTLDFSLTHLLRWWEVSGRSFQGLFETWTHFRIAEGTDGLINAIAADARTDIRLNTPVAKVSSGDSDAAITTRDGLTFRAPVVIVATPAQVWGRIEFCPRLTAEHLEFSAASCGPEATEGTKVYANIEGEPRSFFVLGGEAFPVPVMWTVKRDGSRQTVIAFSAAEAQVRSALKEILPHATVLDVMPSYNWDSDEFSLGHPDVRPGLFTRLIPFERFAKPHGRVLFASSNLAYLWPQYIDGAIESGMRAAVNAKQQLRALSS